MFDRPREGRHVVRLLTNRQDGDAVSATQASIPPASYIRRHGVFHRHARDIWEQGLGTDSKRLGKQTRHIHKVQRHHGRYGIMRGLGNGYGRKKPWVWLCFAYPLWAYGEELMQCMVVFSAWLTGLRGTLHRRCHRLPDKSFHWRITTRVGRNRREWRTNREQVAC